MAVDLELQIIGNLGKDAELETNKNGWDIVKFSVGRNSKKKDGTSITVWVDCSWFFKTGSEIKILPYLKKGTKVLVKGEPGLQVWAKKDDNSPQGKIDCKVDNLLLLGTKEDGHSNNNPQSATNTPPPPAAQAAPAAQATAPVDDPFASMSDDSFAATGKSPF